MKKYLAVTKVMLSCIIAQIIYAVTKYRRYYYVNKI